MLLQQSKEDFLNHVERENPKVKQAEFVDFCEDTIYEIRYNSTLFQERYTCVIRLTPHNISIAFQHTATPSRAAVPEEQS